MTKSLSLIIIVSLIIHSALFFFKKEGFTDEDLVRTKAITAEKAFDFGYMQGYHRATEDLAEIHASPEIH